MGLTPPFEQCSKKLHFSLGMASLILCCLRTNTRLLLVLISWGVHVVLQTMVVARTGRPLPRVPTERGVKDVTLQSMDVVLIISHQRPDQTQAAVVALDQHMAAALMVCLRRLEKILKAVRCCYCYEDQF